MTTHPDEKRISAIRVSLIEGKPSGPYLGLSFDEKKPNDESFHVQGLTFVMDKSLFEQCGSISIDFVEDGENSGFKIVPSNPLITLESDYSSEAYESQGQYH